MYKNCEIKYLLFMLLKYEVILFKVVDDSYNAHLNTYTLTHLEQTSIGKDGAVGYQGNSLSSLSGGRG